MNFINVMLNRLKISSKLRLIIVLASIIIIGSEIFSANSLREETIVERKEAAQSLVESLVTQINFIMSSSIEKDKSEQLIKDLVSATRYSENGYFFISDLDGVMIRHAISHELNGKNMLNSSEEYVRSAFHDFIQTAKSSGSGFVDYYWQNSESGQLEEKISYINRVNDLPWFIGTGVYFSDVDKAFKEALINTLITSGIILGILIALSAVISRNIIRPLEKITTTMTEIAENKDLTIEMKSQGKDELSLMAAAFNMMNTNIKGVVSNINLSTDTLASQAEELSAVTTQIQGGIVEQKAQTMAVAESTEHLTASSNMVAEKTALTLEETEKATQMIDYGNQSIQENIHVIQNVAERVNDAVITTEKLEQSSNKIGEIIEVIKQVADQTNLLALNAAIEAARAGEHGRGFAVVADEVRTLASRTQQSTESIQAIISELQSDVGTTVGVMRDCERYAAEGIEKAHDCGNAFESIQKSIITLNAMAADIRHSVEEQKNQAAEISMNINSITAVAEQTEIGTLQTSQSSEQLSQMAQELNALVNAFKV